MTKGKRVPTSASAVASQSTVPHLEDLLLCATLHNAADLIENERTWPDCPERAVMVHLLREIARTGKVPHARGEPPHELSLTKENVAFEIDRRRRRGKTLKEALNELADKIYQETGREVETATINTYYRRGVRTAKKRAAKTRDIFADSRARRKVPSTD